MIPKSIKGPARRVWKELAPIAGERLTPETAHSFAQLCASVTQYRAIVEAVNMIPVEELVIEHSNGALGLHPLERVRAQRSKELRTALRDWGLSPDTAEKPEDSTLEEFSEALDGKTSSDLADIRDALNTEADALEAQGHMEAAKKIREKATEADRKGFEVL